MKKVYQTRFYGDEGGGNCISACIASLLEVELSEVPDTDSGRNLIPLREWLKSKNLQLMHMQSSGEGFNPLYCGGGLPAIISVRSPRAECNHAIVVKFTGWKWELLHDPHPDGGEYSKDIRSIWIIVPNIDTNVN